MSRFTIAARTALTCAALAAAAVVVVPLGIASATPIVTLPPASAPGTFTEQNLGTNRTAANFFYRIPALAYLGNNVVLASWDGRPGSADDAPQANSIVQRRSTDGGVTWGPVTTIAAGQTASPKFGYSDPSYVVDSVVGKVFAFFVYSKDQGFSGSVYGNNDTNRNVISAAVVESSNGGVTWSTPRLITNIVKPDAGANGTGETGDVKSMFASSGEGIQLKYGPNAGRLIQQYAGTVRQSNGSEPIQSYSVYSDDHGVTWVKGANVGTGMDENKTVELSDGRVMLNSRDSAGSKFRKVAFSNDGGATYGAVTLDTQLIDPTNNGSVTRLFPDAAQGSSSAKKLLFTNSADQTTRQNVSARVSCDDGTTWPGLRTIRSSFSAYSTATRLDAGRIGVFYEGSYVNDMQFAAFDDAWLNYVCAPLSTPDLSVAVSTTTQVPMTITNQEATSLSGGSVTIATPAGWSAPEVTVPAIAPGASVVVNVPLTSPSSSAAAQRMDAVFTASDGRTSHYGVRIAATGGLNGTLTITGALTGASASRNVTSNPYTAGQSVLYQLSVTSTANVQTASTPVSSSLEVNFAPPAASNCRFLTLAAGGNYACTPSHVVTAADVAKGWFTPTATFTVAGNSPATAPKTVSFTGAPVFLKASSSIPLSASITGQRGDAGRNLATQPYLAGQTVPYSFDVANTSPFIEDTTPTGGAFGPLPPTAGNCRFLNLAIYAAYNCATSTHTVTQPEVDAGFFRATSTWTASASGKTTVTYPIDGGEVDLKVRQPALDTSLTASRVDVDEDYYASAGDQIEITRNLFNAGNVLLTNVAATGAAITATSLGLDESASAITTFTLSQAQVDAGEIVVAGFTATAANGDTPVNATLNTDTFTLDVDPDGAAALTPEQGVAAQSPEQGVAAQSPLVVALEPAATTPTPVVGAEQEVVPTQTKSDETAKAEAKAKTKAKTKGKAKANTKGKAKSKTKAKVKRKTKAQKLGDKRALLW